MKKLLLIVFIFPLLINCQIKQKVSDKEKLIPRKLLFKNTLRSDFKIDEKGEILYFRTSGEPSEIHRLNVLSGKSLKGISLEGKILQYLLIGDAPITVVQNEQLVLHYQDSIFNLPVGAKGVKLLNSIKNNKSVLVQLSFEEEKESGVYQFDLENGKFDMEHENEGFSSVFYDELGNRVAAQAYNDRGGIELYFFENASWQLIEEFDWDANMFIGGICKILSVSNDGRSVYYTGNKDSDKTKLYKFDVASKVSSVIAENEKVDLLPFGFSKNDSGNVKSVVGLYAKTLREYTDKITESDFDWLNAQLDGDVGFIQSTTNNTKWLIRELSGGPGKLYLFDRKKRSLQFLLADEDYLEEYQLAKRTAYEVETRDGLKLPLHIYLPPGSDKNEDGIPDEPLPTIVYIHGGPWVGLLQWNQKYYWRNFQLLANRGYAVINCEFRGTSGLGKDMIEQSYNEWGKSMINDKLDVVNWAVEKGISDSKRIGIWGWSYGGYASLTSMALHPKVFACGVSMYGITDLPAFINSPFGNNNWWKNTVGDPASDEELSYLKSVSPIHQAKNIKAPVLLTTGSKDKRVMQSQVDRMADTLNSLNKDVTYFYYTEEGHDYRSTDSWVSFWAVSEQFLKENLGGQAEAIGNDFELGEKELVYGASKIETWKKQ